MAEDIVAAYDDYAKARSRLVELSPCPKCCPPRHPCGPGEYILGGDILRCRKCGGDGFVIDWEDD